MTKISKSLFDMWILGIQIRGALVGINRVADLIVACLIESAKIEPNLADVGVNPDRLAVRIQRISVLVNLEVEKTNRTPEGRVLAVAVDSLLVRLICLVVFLLSHIASSHQVPRLGICTVSLDRAGQKADSLVLIHECSVLLMIKPSELL